MIGVVVLIAICFVVASASQKREPEPQPRYHNVSGRHSTQAQQGGDGTGLMKTFLWGVAAIAVLGIVLAGAFPEGALQGGSPDVVIQDRVDNHAVTKHGETASQVISRLEGAKREYYYIPVEEKVLVRRCDTSNCVHLYVGVRGLSMGNFSPQMLGNLDALSLSAYPKSLTASNKEVVNYQFLGSW